MFQKVEINIPLLDAIKYIPKYAKFLKELCIHKRKKMKGRVELRGIVSALTRIDDIIAGAQQALPKKFRDPKIFSVLCTIGDCTLDLGALINDEALGKGSTLILGRPFLMTTKTKIDVHVEMLSMEFGDNLVHFNIFEAMKHPTEDHSLFGIDMIDELVEEHLQLDVGSDDISIFAGDTNIFDCLRSVIDEADYDRLWEEHNLSNSADDTADLANLSHEAKTLDLFDQVCKYEEPECSKQAEVQVSKTKKQLLA
ncbi:hypothetical protein CR513_42273, partial [Mucuna pruriens]